MSELLLCLTIFIISAQHVQANSDLETQAAASQQEMTQDAENQKNRQVIESAIRVMKQGQISQAQQLFSTVVAFYEEKFADDEAQLYTARTPQESLYYLMQGAVDKKSTRLVPREWSDAYQLIGFAYVEQNDYESAKPLFEKAIDMAPMNAIYRAELAHVYQQLRDWEKSKALFELAEQAAEQFSPEPTKMLELTRAKRGVGFSLFEMGDLKGAEQKYKECLVLNKNDTVAQAELRFIEQTLNNPARKPKASIQRVIEVPATQNDQ